MEGVIQYRLLGDHPAASGRYLTLGFPGESTTRDKVVEQIIQEHRINTSRYKLEVRRLVPARDAPGYQQPSSASSPTQTNAGGSAEVNATAEAAASRDAMVGIVLQVNEDLHTYDRLTIHVSQRQLADDDANRKEQEQLERQRRVREMELELLATTAAVLPNLPSVGRGVGSGAHTPSPPPQASSSPQPEASSSSRDGGRPAAVDSLRLLRAAALASQLFPTMKGQHGALTGVDDPANTHQCVLCRLAAFAEVVTPCCHFCVCASCYASATEMDMEEGRCPVCGNRTAVAVKYEKRGDEEAEDISFVHGRSGSHKRGRDGADAAPSRGGGWKREEGDASKAALQRSLGLGESRGSGGGVAAAAGKGDSLGPSVGPSLGVSREVLLTEERLRQDLERAFAFLEGPDVLTASAKEQRVIGAELAALCGSQ